MFWHGEGGISTDLFNARYNFFPTGTEGNHEKLIPVNQSPSGSTAHKWTKVSTNGATPPKWTRIPLPGPTSPKPSCHPLTGFSSSSLSLRFSDKSIECIFSFLCLFYTPWSSHPTDIVVINSPSWCIQNYKVPYDVTSTVKFVSPSPTKLLQTIC